MAAVDIQSVQVREQPPSTSAEKKWAETIIPPMQPPTCAAQSTCGLMPQF